MATVSPSVSAKSPKRFFRCSKVRSTPALHRLEKRGWLAAEWGESEKGRQAKFYKLSAKGRRQLASEESNWKRLAGAVVNILQTVE